MLTSTSTSTSRSARTVKSLNECPREEAKTPEIETVETAPVKQVDKSKKSTPKKSVKSKVSPLSARALKVKQSIIKKEVVQAVILKPDGTSEEIKYNTSSKQANKILNGRPTIIGELEQIQVVIVRSLNQKNCGGLNKNILPVPFCNKQYNGNYLLYRVDSKGNSTDLSLKQYEKYVADNKTLTAQARKNYDPIDNQEIRAKSPFNSNSKLTMVYLRSEVDKKVRTEFKEKNGRNPTESEIEESVNIAVQKLVNDLVSSSSPMNDPDYNPNDDDESKQNGIDSEKVMIDRLRRIYREENGVDINNEDLIRTLKIAEVAETADDDIVDGRDWRLQLNDALNYVRERGRLDGRILAEKISATFYELNGVEPTLDELIEVFRRIKSELAEEAISDINEDGESDAYRLAKKLAPSMVNNPDPTEIVNYAEKIVVTDLVSRAKSAFISINGRSPTKYELKNSVERLALKLADKAIERNENVEDMNDPDYDPNNVTDKRLAKNDELEDREFDDNYFNLRMLTTPNIKSKTGIAEKYDVYFCKFDKKRESQNLLKAIDSFKMRNRREPTNLEINRLRRFLSTNKETSLVQFKLSVVSDSEDDDEQKENLSVVGVNKIKTTPSKVLVTPVKKKKTAARYNVYFEDNNDSVNKNEKMAIKWFRRFNNRKPNELELGGIKQFIKTDKSDLIECEYDVPCFDDVDNANDDDLKQTEEDDNAPKMKTNFVVKKTLSTKYTLDFDDKQQRENGDEKQAIKWFKRFNSRNPTDSEQEKIKQFIKADNDDTVDID